MTRYPRKNFDQRQRKPFCTKLRAHVEQLKSSPGTADASQCNKSELLYLHPSNSTILNISPGNKSCLEPSAKTQSKSQEKTDTPTTNNSFRYDHQLTFGLEIHRWIMIRLIATFCIHQKVLMRKFHERIAYIRLFRTKSSFKLNQPQWQLSAVTNGLSCSNKEPNVRLGAQTADAGWEGSLARNRGSFHSPRCACLATMNGICYASHTLRGVNISVKCWCVTLSLSVASFVFGLVTHSNQLMFTCNTYLGSQHSLDVFWAILRSIVWPNDLQNFSCQHPWSRFVVVTPHLGIQNDLLDNSSHSFRQVSFLGSGQHLNSPFDSLSLSQTAKWSKNHRITW